MPWFTRDSRNRARFWDVKSTGICNRIWTIPCNRVAQCAQCFHAHDVTAAILVSRNNETAALLVSQTSPVGVKLFLLQTLSMVPINLHRYWPREWKHSIGPVNYIVINFRSDHTSHYGMYARLFNTYQRSNRSILNSPEIPSWSSNHRNCIQLFWVYILSQQWLVQRLHWNICCTRRP